MGRLSNKDKAARLIKPTHEVHITINGAKFEQPWKVTEEAGLRILDTKQAALLEALRQVNRPTKNRLETKTGYGTKVFELKPLVA